MYLRKFAVAAACVSLAFLSYGCLGQNKNPDAALTVGASANGAMSGPGGLAGFQQSVYAFARNNCAECHGNSQNPLFAVSDVNAAYSAALNYVNFKSIPFSLLVTKANDGHCGMPGCSNNGNTMIRLIQQWQAAYSSAGNGGAPSGTAVLIGNVFTNALTIPSPNSGCATEGILPDGSSGSGATTDACSPDGLDNQRNGSNGQPPAACTNTCWTKLRYPVALMSPTPSNAIARAWFEVDFAYDNYATVSGPASYQISNPRIVSLDSPVYVHDVRTFLNGAYQPSVGQEYQNADLVVTPWSPPSTCNNAGATSATAAAAAAALAAPASSWLNGANAVKYAAAIEACNIPSVPNIYSTAITATGILQQNPPVGGNPTDQISFSFDYFQPGITAPCSNQSFWLANVYNIIKDHQMACLNCHRSGGNVTEAGQRFNMDDTDPINCPAGVSPDRGNAPGDVNGQCYVTGCGCTQAQAQTVVCEKFLQRSNLANPSESAIIVQPSAGLNGMPAQPGFGDFEPTWIQWINSEASAQGK